MPFDSTIIDAIADLGDAASSIQNIEGQTFHVSRKGAVAIKFPAVETLNCFSLTQIANYIKTHTLEADRKLVLNVANFNLVQLHDDELDENQEITTFAESNFEDVYPAFPTERKMTQEDFIINVMTKFERDENCQQLLKLISNVKAEKTSTSDDDGYSQVATVKGGVMLSRTEEIKNIWELRTFKTFPEIEQPVIPYVLRLHQVGDNMPLFALYDCDGGAWKVKATANIRAWFEQRLKSDGLLDKVSVL